MALSAFLKNISSIASVLPRPVYGLLTLMQARLALQAGAADRALTLAQKGISDLEGTARSTVAPETVAQPENSLKAALTSVLAIALKRIGNDNAGAQEAYQAADARFTGLLSADAARIVPFLGDYLLMLVEFEATQKALDVAETVSNTAQALAAGGESGAAGGWLKRLTLLTPTVRMIMELGKSLAPANPEGAFEAFLQAAGVAVASNDQAMASEALERALEIHPDDDAARRMRGLLRWRAGETLGAAEDFAAAVAGNGEDLESRVALARARIELKQPEEAVEHLDIVLSRQSKHTDALWLRGMAELRIGEDEASKGRQDEPRAHWTAAIQNFTAALEQKPEHAACRRSRAIAFYRLGKLPEALEDLNNALTSDPDDVEGHGWRAVLLSALGKYDEALAAVNVALALVGNKTTLQGKRAWLLGIRGEALLATNWPDEAIVVLKEAMDLEPGNENMPRALFKAYRAKGDWQGIAESARNLQDIPEYSPEFLSDLRKLEITGHRNAYRYEEAFAAIDRALVLQVDDPEFRWLRARLLADVGDFEAACDALPEADKTSAGAVDQLSLRGWAFQNLEARDMVERRALGDQGRYLYEAALELAKEQSKNKTQGIWLRKGRANALLRSGARDEAYELYDEIIEECEQTLREYKPNARLMSLAGWCYHCREDHAAALRCYEGAQNAGEPSIGSELDHALALAAAESTATAPETPGSLDRYQDAIRRAEKENVLRRIGLLRVALHDARELSFRKADFLQYAGIRKLLGEAMREAMKGALSPPAGFIEHLRSFLAVVEAAPESLSEQETVAP